MKLTDTITTEYAQLEAHLLGKQHTDTIKEKFDPLLHAYKVWLLEYIEEDGGSMNVLPDDEYSADYDVARGIIRTVRPNYSQDTLTHFCIDIIPFETAEFFTKTGLFLSAFINLAHQKTGEENYILDVSLFSVPLDYIGVENKANITIHGNVKDYLGKSMNKGRIVLNGNCESSAGADMYDGEIIVQGNAVSDIGNFLRGGTIRIKGNAGIDVGLEMCIGTIYLDGTYTNLADARMRGTIYHKDEIIWRQI